MGIPMNIFLILIIDVYLCPNSSSCALQTKFPLMYVNFIMTKLLNIKKKKKKQHLKGTNSGIGMYSRTDSFSYLCHCSSIKGIKKHSMQIKYVLLNKILAIKNFLQKVVNLKTGWLLDDTRKLLLIFGCYSVNWLHNILLVLRAAHCSTRNFILSHKDKYHVISLICGI